MLSFVLSDPTPYGFSKFLYSFGVCRRRVVDLFN